MSVQMVCVVACGDNVGPACLLGVFSDVITALGRLYGVHALGVSIAAVSIDQHCVGLWLGRLVVII